VAGFEALGFPVATGSHRVLAIDPGLASVGWAVLDAELDGARPELRESGVISTPSSASLVERVGTIAAELGAIDERVSPDLLAFESYTNYGRVHWNGVQTLYAIGVILALAHLRGREVVSIGARSAKLRIGVTDGSKASVKLRVEHLLGLPKPVRSEHAADAMAVGLAIFATQRAAAPANDNAQAPARKRGARAR